MRTAPKGIAQLVTYCSYQSAYGCQAFLLQQFFLGRLEFLRALGNQFPQRMLVFFQLSLGQHAIGYVTTDTPVAEKIVLCASNRGLP